MVQGKRNYPLPLQPHPQNQKQNQPKTYIGFGTANGGTSEALRSQVGVPSASEGNVFSPQVAV
jgi:hypothetical protein